MTYATLGEAGDSRHSQFAPACELANGQKFVSHEMGDLSGLKKSLEQASPYSRRWIKGGTGTVIPASMMKHGKF